MDAVTTHHFSGLGAPFVRSKGTVSGGVFNLQIDPQRRLVWQSGQMVDLTPMEFDILLLLARRPGQVFSARQIYEAVATDSYDASWTGISSMVYKLRRKLGAGIIETVRGHGYKFVAPGTSPK